MVTVTSKDCSGRGGCSYSGDFVSDDGKVQRSGVGLASGFSDLAVGVRVVALDDGDPNNAFPPGGGQDWIYVTLILAGAIGVLGAWIYLVPIGALRRRRPPDDAGTEDDEAPGPVHAVAAGPNAGTRFTVVRLREGYDIDEVDAFVDRVASGGATSTEAQRMRFTPVRLRQGYDMGQVDEYLDGIAAELSASGR
jgi:DivIVA domain-containing protein